MALRARLDDVACRDEDCRIDANPACSWSPAAYKHFPFRGMTPKHTERGPARYAPGLGQNDIQTMETTTARQGTWCRGRFPARKEYLRDAEAVIGWDLGQDATLSFVECSGGTTVRSFHGRPMTCANPKAKGFTSEEAT